MNGRGPKLGTYVPLMSFNKVKSGIFEKIFFDFYEQICTRAMLILVNFGTFLHKFFFLNGFKIP